MSFSIEVLKPMFGFVLFLVHRLRSFDFGESVFVLTVVVWSHVFLSMNGQNHFLFPIIVYLYLKYKLVLKALDKTGIYSK